MSLTSAQSQLVAKVLETRTVLSESAAYYRPIQSSFLASSLQSLQATINTGGGGGLSPATATAANVPATPTTPIAAASSSLPLSGGGAFANLLGTKEEECLLVSSIPRTHHFSTHVDD